MRMKFFFTLLIVLLFIFIVGCTQTVEQDPSLLDEKVNVSFKYIGGGGIVLIEKEFEIIKGTNAFEFLKENFEVGYEEYAFGPMIKSFDGITPPDGYYLSLYVNDVYAEKGISEYTLSEDILIEFRFESLSTF